MVAKGVSTGSEVELGRGGDCAYLALQLNLLVVCVWHIVFREPGLASIGQGRVVSEHLLSQMD